MTRPIERKPPGIEDLRSSEELFRQIAENVGEVLWMADPDRAHVHYISPAYERIWGRSAESLYADPMSFIESVHPDDRRRVLEALPLQAEGGYHLEYRVVRPDGGLRWVRARAFPVRDAEGRVYRVAGIATDITERLRTVERQRQINAELDERVRMLIDTANDAVLTIDQGSVILDWNAKAEQMFGWSAGEALGRILTELIVPGQHRARHHHGLARFLAGEDLGTGGILNRRVETTALHRDGREFDVELSVWPVKTGAGWTFSSFIRDISERKRTEEALRSSEERYRAVVENANEGIIVTQDGKIRFGNSKAFTLTDRTPEEAMATPFIEMIHPDDRARVYGNYLRRMRGEPVENNYTFRVITPRGEVMWLQISAVSIDWEGKPATLNFLSDVTRQVLLQENLKQTLAEREAVLETTAVGILHVQDGRIKWANAALEQQLLGHEPGALIGKTAEITFASHAEWSRCLAECVPRLQSEGAYSGEWQARRSDGSLVWCELSGRAIDPAELARGTIWFYIDIGERKRAEEEIRRALARERELSELKTRFVAMTSHEFRTPLATILSSAELIEDFGDTLPATERREVVNLIKGAVRRMNGMLEQVLFIGRAESNKLEFKPLRSDARALAARLLAEAQRAAGDKLVLALECTGEQPWRELDEDLLTHAVGNLLSNAVKYSPRGATVRLALELRPAELEFSVIDRGIGIPAEDQARLFETFQRARNVGNIEGTGLGLAIARQCAELHGGSISFASEAGRGSTFRLHLPVPATD